MPALYSIDTMTGEIMHENGSRFMPDDTLAAYQEYVAWLQLGNTPDYLQPQDAGATNLTVLAFRNRFTQTEKITIEMASLDNPLAAPEQRQFAAALRVYMRDVDNATFINVTLPETIGGVQTLEQYGLLAPGRADAILNTAPTVTELYKG